MAAELQFESETTMGPSQPTAAPSLNSLADKAVQVACKMLEDGVIGRQPRFQEIRKNEDMANGAKKPALRGRSNIDFDSAMMRGYIDTLMSNVDEQVVIKFGHNREQDKLAADKQSAVFDVEKGSANGALDEKIMLMKHLASLAGRGFIKVIMGNKPKFHADWEVCDHYDMIGENQGGSDLDKHLGKFQMNIFKTKQQLRDGVVNGDYDPIQVRKLMYRYMDTSWFKNNDDIFNNKAVRYAAFGIDIRANNYVGQPLYRMTEGVINYEGKWYYIVFSREARLWITFMPLEEKFAWATKYPGRGPWLSFATHPHPYLFWSVAPADDIRPFAYAVKKVGNLTIDNLEKRNWDMKAYDPHVITDPSQLLWRQDGLIRANVKNGAAIGNSIFQIQTPDTTQITINLMQFLDQFLGKQSGITPDNPNQPARDPRVAIQVTNIDQTSKRMTLYSKHFRKLYTDLAAMFDYGCYQYLREPYAIKLIGTEGVQWDEYLTREDVNKEFQINVISGLDSDEKNATLMARRSDIFTEILSNQTGFIKNFNPKWLAKETLKIGGYKEEATKEATDTQIDGDSRLYAEAADSIQKIIDGGKPPLNRGATPGFVQKIIDFAQDHYPLMQDADVAKLSPGSRRAYGKKLMVYDKLMAYAKAHTLPAAMNKDGTPGQSIIQQNMQRRALNIQLQQAMNSVGSNPTPGGSPQPGAGPTPSAPLNQNIGQPAGGQPVAA